MESVKLLKVTLDLASFSNLSRRKERNTLTMPA